MTRNRQLESWEGLTGRRVLDIRPMCQPDELRTGGEGSLFQAGRTSCIYFRRVSRNDSGDWTASEEEAKSKVSGGQDASKRASLEGNLEASAQ